MPVKIIHWRYVFLDVDDNHDHKKLFELFRKLFGYQLYALSGLRLVEKMNNIVIYAISSKYVPQLIATTVFYGELYGEKIILRGVSSTIKSGKKVFTK